MALDKLSYSKNWTNPEDFPTYQPDETQVRADMQFLFDETETFINDTLIPQTEEAIGNASISSIPDGGIPQVKLASDVSSAVDRAKAGGAIDTALADKAPAGYGLGGSGAYVVDLNTAIESGFYYWDDTASNAPFTVANGGGSMFVVRRSNPAYAAQYAFDNTQYIPYMCVRVKTNEEWSEWEWVNPPMSPGVEYRTTERWMDMPVYVKVVQAGACPDGSTVQYKILPTAHRIIGWRATAGEYGRVLPYKDNYGSGLSISAGIIYNEQSDLDEIGSTWIELTSTANFSSLQAYVYVKYVKT